MSGVNADRQAELEQVRASVRAACERHGIDYWRKTDAEKAYPEAFMATMAEAGFLGALIDHLVQTQGVDPRRVYVTGISNGGMMSYRLAAEIPERVAAIAAVAGTLDVPPSSIRQPVPILHFHGTADEYVLYEGGHGPKTFSDNDHTSVADTMAAWVKVNGANPAPKEELLPDTSDDGMRVTRYTYSTKTDPRNIVLYRIEGGGHTWPGRPAKIERMLGPATTDISANDILWEFFQAHPKVTAESTAK